MTTIHEGNLDDDAREARIRERNHRLATPDCQCPWCFILRRLDDTRRELDAERAAYRIARRALGCQCPPCPGRGNDGHGREHCAECCFGTGVEADIACPEHGEHPTPTTALVRSAPQSRARENGRVLDGGHDWAPRWSTMENTGAGEVTGSSLCRVCSLSPEEHERFAMRRPSTVGEVDAAVVESGGWD